MVDTLTAIIKDITKMAPSTRYQGSKRRMLPWLYDNVKDLPFQTALDGFGGTASVSYLFKLMGKSVTFNDVLLSNYQTGVAIIENDSVKLEQSDIDFLVRDNGFNYPHFIQETFKDVYYIDSENEWLDMIAFNIKMLSEFYSDRVLTFKNALAYHALFQACLCKRPFNLFHRKNLHLRLGEVERSFGNKTTWDSDFASLFSRFAYEVSERVFYNSKQNKAICKDIATTDDVSFDLVYLDPPYTRIGEKRPKDYRSLYHFLEGIVEYDNWASMINWSKVNRSLLEKNTSWEQNSPEVNFELLFKKFSNSIIVVSYGRPGNPSIQRITDLLRSVKSTVDVVEKGYAYSLNRRNHSGMYEALIVGR